MQVEVDLTLEKCNNRQGNKVVYCIMRHADFRYSRRYIITCFQNIQIIKSYFKIWIFHKHNTTEVTKRKRWSWGQLGLAICVLSLTLFIAFPFPSKSIFKKDCKTHVIIEDLLPLVPQSCIQQQYHCFICFLSIHLTFTRYRWMFTRYQEAFWIATTVNCCLKLTFEI